MQTLIGVNIFIIAVIFISGYFIDKQSSSSVFYGVRTPIGYEKNEKLKNISKRYKINYSLSFGIFTILYFALQFKFEEHADIIMIIGIFIMIFISTINYYIAYRQVKHLKESEKWVLESKNVVAVDLNYRNKDSKNRRQVISPLWFLIPLALLIVSAVIMIRQNDTSTLIIQIMLSLMFFIIYISVGRAKQNLNGGDANQLKDKSRKYRYIMSILMFSICVCMNIGLLGQSLLIANIIDGKLMQYMLIAVYFVPIISIIPVIFMLGQEGKNLKTNNSDTKEVIINREDDNNYKFGIFYYNKKDPAVFVNKRMGIGWTFNYAKWQAKLITAVILAIAIVPLSYLYLAPSMSKGSTIDFTEQTANIHGMYGIDIKYDNIDKVEFMDSLPKVYTRNNGFASANRRVGKFTLENYKNSVLYIMDSSKACVYIGLKDGRSVFINYKDLEQTKKVYQEFVDLHNTK
jgi:uncharacterized membrane protein